LEEVFHDAVDEILSEALADLNTDDNLEKRFLPRINGRYSGTPHMKQWKEAVLR